jgi:hypothetical protein
MVAVGNAPAGAVAVLTIPLSATSRFRSLFIERWSRPHLDSAQGAARDSSYSWSSQFISKKEHRR